MLTPEDKQLILDLIREKAYSLRIEQRKIEKMRVNLKTEKFMEEIYYKISNQLLELHMLLAKICYL